MDGLAAYIADNYGICRRDTDCYHGPGCRKTGWIGRACPHWQPVKAKTWEELAIEQRDE